MAADIKIAVTRVALSTSYNGDTQDVTITGDWTPKAAIFIHQGGASNNTISSGARFGIGFTDGTNQNATGFTSKDASGTTLTSRHESTDRCITSPTAAFPSGEDYGFAFNSWINSGGLTGVRLTISKAVGAGKYVTVVLLGGDDLSSAHAGHKDDLGSGTSPVDINTVGFEPDVVFMTTVGGNSPPPNALSQAIYTFGAALNDGSATQRISAMSSVSAQSSSVVSGYIGNTKITGQQYNDAVSWLGTIGSFDSSGFSITPSASASSDIVYFLCLKFANNPGLALFDVSLPTSGNYAETTPGFEPIFGLISSVVGPSTRNAVYSGSVGYSVAAFDASTIAAQNATDKDAAGTTVSKSLSSDALRILDGDGSTISVAASSYALDSSGWDFTLTTNPSSAVLGWGLAIGTDETAVAVSPNDISQSQTIDNVTLTQGYTLAVQDVAQGNSIDAVTLTQANVLSAADIGQDQSLDNVTLTQVHVIAVNDLSQANLIDGVTLTAAGVLAVAGIDQAQLIDATALTQAGILSVADISQDNAIDNVTLTVAGSLAIQGVTQNNLIDGVTLTQAGTLSIADLTQSQIIDVAALTQHYTIAVNSLLQGHTLDGVTLSLGGSIVAPDDIGQGQTIDPAGLTEYAVLSVNDLTQSQLLDIVNLGGLVVGCLEGTLVVYALVDGTLTQYSLLDATPTTVH